MRPTSLGFGTDLALLRLVGSEVLDRGDHLVIRSPHNPRALWRLGCIATSVSSTRSGSCTRCGRQPSSTRSSRR